MIGFHKPGAAMRSDVNPTADRDAFVVELLVRFRKPKVEKFVPRPKRDRMDPIPTPPPGFYDLAEEQQREVMALLGQAEWSVHEYVNAGRVIRVGPHQEDGVRGFRITTVEIPFFPAPPAPPLLPPPSPPLLPRLLMIAIPVGLLVVAAVLVFGGGQAAPAKESAVVVAKPDTTAQSLDRLTEKLDALTGKLEQAVRDGKEREKAIAQNATELQAKDEELKAAKSQLEKQQSASAELLSQQNKAIEAMRPKAKVYDAIMCAIADAKKQRDWIAEFHLVGTGYVSQTKYDIVLGTFSVKDGFTPTRK